MAGGAKNATNSSVPTFITIELTNKSNKNVHKCYRFQCVKFQKKDTVINGNNKHI